MLESVRYEVIITDKRLNKRSFIKSRIFQGCIFEIKLKEILRLILT